MNVTWVSGPTTEVITVADVKAQLNLYDHMDDDALIARLISGARQVAEDLTGRTVGTSRWAASDLAWPRGREIIVPRPPFAALVTFTYVDGAGVTQTVSDTLYYTATVGEFGRVLLKDGQVWPTARMRAPGWTVTYDAGHATVVALPAGLLEGMYQLIAHWYAHREGIVVGDSGMRVAELPMGIRELFKRVDVR